MTPQKAHFFSPRRTISRDLTLGLALMTALVVSIFGAAYQLYFTNKEAVELKREAAAIADEFAEVLTHPLWNLDLDTVVQITRAYLTSDFVIGVRVRTDQENYFDNIPDHASMDRWYYLERNIVYQGQTIGSTELLFSEARIQSIRRRSLNLTLVTIFLVTLVIGLGTHQLMKRLLVSPLNRLIAGIRTIAAGDYQLALPSEKRSDIDALISEINIMAREISRREYDLIKLRETLKSIVDSMPSVLVGVDPEGRVTQWNREAQKQTGIDVTQAMGRNIEGVYPSLAGAMQKVNRAIQENLPQKESKVARQIDGETRFFDITIYPLMAIRTGGAVIRVDDVTDRVRIEEIMVQSEKMLSLGGLAAGMAHEINNPLAGMMQNVQVIQYRLFKDLPKNQAVAERCGITMAAVRAYAEGRNIPEMMASIMESGNRAARIVENMLSFSRSSEAKTIRCDLARLMDATLELAKNDYDLKKRYDFRQIQIVREYDPRVPPVACEATEIQQVFLNILKNGAQAMADNQAASAPRFVLRIKADAHMARIEIEDNGPGMEATVCKRIFEPFFTTKSVGIGTGLGLSVSYFIVTENHGGTLTVSSKPGVGSRFVIRLPLEND